MTYKIEFTEEFLRQYKKIKKKDFILAQKIYKIIDLLATEPFALSLRTHKANITGYGYFYSSRVTGNMRIGWNFKDERAVIICLKVGGHDEVYK